MTGSIGSSPVGTHSSSNNATSYATGSFTPTAGTYLVVDGYIGGTQDAAGMTCTASANGLTFTKITADTHSLSLHTSLLWVSDQAVPSSPSAMTVTVGVPNDAGTSALIGVFEATGLTAGGASSIRSVSGTPQVGKTLNITAGGAYNCSLPAAPLTTNPLFGSVHSAGTMQAVGQGVIPPSGFTEIWEPADQSAAVIGLEIAKSDSGITSAGPHTWTADGGTQRTRANIYLVEFDTGAAVNDGEATGAVGWAGAATGARASAGAATGAVGWAGSSTGAHPQYGAASGAVDYAGSATGARASAGAATGAVDWAGSASGSKPSGGSATGAVGWAGSSTGARASAGSATGAVEWAGSATGQMPAGAAHEGAATGAVDWVGSATGAHPQYGAASGTVGWAGSATGSSPHGGTASGTDTYAGASTGSSPHGGAGSGDVGWAGSATGARTSAGAATGAVEWAGAATGARASAGAASGAVGWAGAATGTAQHQGAATGATSYAGASTGTSPHGGTGAGTNTYAGTAVGTSLPAPLNFTATVIGPTEIDLDWDPVVGAIGYHVYRDDVMIGTALTDSWPDTGLDEATEYCYRVVAVR